jgi:tRNA G37 N-methylase Trm5
MKIKLSETISFSGKKMSSSSILKANVFVSKFKKVDFSASDKSSKFTLKKVKLISVNYVKDYRPHVGHYVLDLGIE